MRFSYGGMTTEKAGLIINAEKCIGCGKCAKICSFSAPHKIRKNYAIDGSRCDECGNCFLNCPAGAIRHKGNRPL